MLKIWGRATSINVQKVLLCADFLGLRYERVDAGLSFGVVDTPAYRALNPNGLVPTIEDDGFVLWESNAIVRYLCAKDPSARAYPRALEARADAERWMDWQLTALNAPIATLFWGLVRSPGSRSAEEVAAARVKAAAAMSILDHRLSAVAWVGGAAVGMADFAIGPFVHRFLNLPGSAEGLASLKQYYARLMDLPVARGVLTLPLV